MMQRLKHLVSDIMTYVFKLSFNLTYDIPSGRCQCRIGIVHLYTCSDTDSYASKCHNFNDIKTSPGVNYNKMNWREFKQELTYRLQ